MLCDILKQLRQHHKLGTEQVAEAIGISGSAYRNYERGERTPDYDKIVKIADFYNVTTDYLLGRTGEKLEPLDALAKEKNMHIIEKTMLEMYFKLDPKQRADFIEAMVNAIQSADAPKNQIDIRVKSAARNGTTPSIETITQAEADEIRSRPDADPDL